MNIKKNNNKGLNTDPSETPEDIYGHLEKLLPNFTFIVKFVKNI